jgi:hypothetical protein
MTATIPARFQPAFAGTHLEPTIGGAGARACPTLPRPGDAAARADPVSTMRSTD